jgi:hypothetical protein
MLRIQSNLNEKQLRYEEIQFLAQRLFDNNRQLQMNQEEIVQLNSEIDTNTIYDMWQKDMIKDLKEKVDEREEHIDYLEEEIEFVLKHYNYQHAVEGVLDDYIRTYKKLSTEKDQEILNASIAKGVEIPTLPDEEKGVLTDLPPKRKPAKYKAKKFVYNVTKRPYFNFDFCTSLEIDYIMGRIIDLDAFRKKVVEDENKGPRYRWNTYTKTQHEQKKYVPKPKSDDEDMVSEAPKTATNETMHLGVEKKSRVIRTPRRKKKTFSPLKSKRQSLAVPIKDQMDLDQVTN